MEEQSHKSEMRAALQGDFERLRARQQTGSGESADEQSVTHGKAAEPPAAVALRVPAAPELSWLDRLRRLR